MIGTVEAGTYVSIAGVTVGECLAGWIENMRTQVRAPASRPFAGAWVCSRPSPAMLRYRVMKVTLEDLVRPDFGVKREPCVAADRAVQQEAASVITRPVVSNGPRPVPSSS